MDRLFKRISHTVIEIELHHNAVPSIFFLGRYSMNMIIDPLLHTPFRFKGMYPQIHYQKLCVVCYKNGKNSAMTFF